MKSYFLTLFFTSTIVLFSAINADAAGKTYVNGIDGNYVPFAYVDKAGNAVGFDVDAMNWIAKKMGFSVTHVALPWDGIIENLLTGKVDMICSGLSITANRASDVAFSDPYFTIRKVLVVRQASSLSSEQVLTGEKQLGVQRGTNEAEWLSKNRDQNKWNYELRYYDSPRGALDALLGGAIDATGMDSAPAENAIKILKLEVKIVGEFAPKDEFGVAIRKEDMELRQLINQGYALLKADPYWDELKKKYLCTEN